MNVSQSLDTTNSAQDHKEDAWRYASQSRDQEQDVSDASSVSTATEACTDDNKLRDVQSFRCDDWQSEPSIDEECDARMDDINSNCKEFAFTSDDVGRIGVTDDKHAQTLSEVSSLCSFEVWETVDDDSGEGSGIITEPTVELSHANHKVKDEINEASSVRKDEEFGETRVVVEEKGGNMLEAHVEKDIVLSEKKPQKEAPCKMTAKAVETCDKNSPNNSNLGFIPDGKITQCDKSAGIYTIDKHDTQEAKLLTIPKPRVNNLDFLRDYILPELERQESLSSNTGSEPAKKGIKPKYGKDYTSVYGQKRPTTTKKQASCKQVIEKGVIPSKGNTVENHDSKQVTQPKPLPLRKQSPANNLKQKPQNELDMPIKKKNKVEFAKDISQYSQRAPTAGKSRKTADNYLVKKHATKQLTRPRQLPPLKTSQAKNPDVLRSNIIPELERHELLSPTSGSESNNHAKKNIKPKYGKVYVSPYDQKPQKKLDMSAKKSVTKKYGNNYTSPYSQKAASEKQACRKVNGKGTSPGKDNLHLETFKSAPVVVQSMATDGKMNMASPKKHTPIIMGRKPPTSPMVGPRRRSLKPIDANKLTTIIMGGKLPSPPTVAPPCRSMKPLDANRHTPIIMERKPPSPPPMSLWKDVVTATLKSTSGLGYSVLPNRSSVHTTTTKTSFHIR